MTQNNSFYVIVVNIATILFTPSCGSKADKNETHSNMNEIHIDTMAGEKHIKEIAVAPPPFTEGIFPCSECHKDMKPNPVRRQLVEMHDDIDTIFKHDEKNRWCLDCHHADQRDSLKLASGKLLGFNESYKLCGQCHGDKLRDWKVGVHGKRTGYWNGKKQYLLCVHCHNPHSPKFKKVKPLPPPVRQESIH